MTSENKRNNTVITSLDEPIDSIKYISFFSFINRKKQKKISLRDINRNTILTSIKLERACSLLTFLLLYTTL